MDGCFAYMYVSMGQRSEEGAGAPGIVKEYSESKYRCQELNLGPLVEEPVFFMVKESLQPHLTPMFLLL